MSKQEKCLVVFEISDGKLGVSVNSKLTGQVASFSLIGESMGHVRFELPDSPTLIVKDSRQSTEDSDVIPSLDGIAYPSQAPKVKRKYTKKLKPSDPPWRDEPAEALADQVDERPV